MDTRKALTLFYALSRESCLSVFRLLAQAGPGGLAAGVPREKLGAPHNTTSFHFSHLVNSGMVSSRKKGRWVIYSANCNLTCDLIAFLIKDCCSVEFASIREDGTTGCAIIELGNACEP
jgi:DNA-binding transcriptional ArsR family regulator